MLKIRLKRTGRKKLAQYKIVIMNAQSRRDGKPIEEIGFFDPHQNKIKINKFNLLKWIKNGAQPTQRVISLIRQSMHYE